MNFGSKFSFENLARFPLSLFLLLALALGEAAGVSAQTVSIKTLFSYDAFDSGGHNTDGRAPNALVDGHDGYIYSTCGAGGSLAHGTLYKIKTDGTGFAVLHTFGAAGDGQAPNGIAVRGTVIYGVTNQGGQNYGTVYKINTDGSAYQIIHNNILNDGANPTSVALSPDGTTLAVTTSSGGPPGTSGSVFALPTSASTSTPVTILHGFTNLSSALANADGSGPVRVAFSPDGKTIYGAASFGGSSSNGTLYSVAVATGTFTLLHTFSSLSSGTSGTNADGTDPTTGLVVSPNGTLVYGTARTGGTAGFGTVFTVTVSTGAFSVVDSFTGGASDGGKPIALALVGGTVYGVNQLGGSAGQGTLWQIPLGTAAVAAVVGREAPDAVAGYPIATPASGSPLLSIVSPYDVTVRIGGTATFAANGSGASAGSISFESLLFDLYFSSIFDTFPIIGGFIFDAINGGGANGAGQIFDGAVPPPSGNVTFTYQWYGHTADGATEVAIPGATGSILSLSGLVAGTQPNVFGGTAGGANYYGPVRCQVTDSNGNTGSSTSANIHVPPYFIRQPVAITVTRGSPATFSVTVGGSQPINLQWFDGPNGIAGAQGSSLPVETTGLPGIFYYGCEATSAFGFANSLSVPLTINPIGTGGTKVPSPSALPPVITQQPTSQSVQPGGNATFALMASGTGPLNYQWYFDGTSTAPNPPVSGGTGQTLAINGVAMGNLGAYYCIVSNAVGSTSTTLALLSITGGVRPTITQQPVDQVVDATQKVIPSITFSVGATGSPTLHYEWGFLPFTTEFDEDSFALTPGKTISGSDSPNLTLAFSEFGEGWYYCTVTNPYGSASTHLASLSATQDPKITVQPKSQTVTAGSNVSFIVVGAQPGYTYAWYNPEGYEIEADLGVTSDSTSSKLTLTGVDPSDIGGWTCVVTDPTTGLSTTTAPAVLQVNTSAGPTLATQPAQAGAAPVSIASGGTVALDALAGAAKTGGNAIRRLGTQAASAFTYQWQFNGQNIQGAISPLLVISKASAANAGTYVCLVTSSSGSTASNPVTIAVDTSSGDLANPGRLINLSVLFNAGSGSQLLTVGFATGGGASNGSQPLLLRATGPALTAFGVTGVLADPKLTLFQGSTVSASNAGWGSNQAAVNAADSATGAFPLTNPASADSALVSTLASGGYTVQVTGKSGDAGSALAEIFDYTPSGAYTLSSPRLINLSCLATVPKSGVLTAGFTIGGATAKTVLVRATGPALAALGVPAVMPDPQLALFDSKGNQVAFNAGWGGDSQLVAAMNTVGAFALANLGGADSVLAVTLPPGGYTAQSTSVSGTAGAALIEVYEVP